jgi:hypothetical protein
MLLRRISLVSLVALTGCASSVSGDVDGEKVPALFSAFFVQRKADVPDPQNAGQLATQFSVNGTGVSVFDGCNGATKEQKNLNDAFETQTKDLKAAAGDIDASKKVSEDFADAIVDFDVKNKPSDLWTVGVTLAGLDKKKLDGGGADINFKEPPADPEFIGGVQICRVNQHPEKKRNEDGFFEIRTHQTCFTGVKGTVDVKQYTEDKTLTIVADVDLSVQNGAVTDPDHDDGAATVTIQGGWCEDLENALDDFDKLVEDRANPDG